jgi:hypothetical protein
MGWEIEMNFLKQIRSTIWDDTPNDLPVVTLQAKDVKEGQVVTGIQTQGISRWRRVPIMRDQDIQPVNGEWPKVTMADYDEKGEGDGPTVYIQLSDRDGWVFCLRPDDQVAVMVSSRKAA